MTVMLRTTCCCGVCALCLSCPAVAGGERAPAWWVHGGFATCVRWNESNDGRNPNARGNLYGVMGADGRFDWAEGVPRWRQDLIAWRLYQRYGVAPWRPHDGC